MNPPIIVDNPNNSLKRYHAKSDAIMGSPIGADATTVGEIYFIAWYIAPLPKRVGIIPKINKPINSYFVKLNNSICIICAIKNNVMLAVKNKVLE